MRIDLTSLPATQITPDKPASANGKSQVETPDYQDQTTLSGDSVVSQLNSTALASPDVRQDRVAALQQQVSSGQYKPDPANIASAMIAYYGK